MPIRYVVDGGPLSGIHDNAAGRALVASASAVWQSVSTAAISFAEAGSTSIGDGDISSLPEYDAAVQACDNATQSPVIFDANGSLLRDLGGDPFIIGFAGPCALDRVTGHIRSALLFLNGQFIDGINSFVQLNPEISMDQFEETVAHEFGHFVGLDHSQVNGDILDTTLPNCSADYLAGLPLMFPFLSCPARKSVGLPVLAPDDMAWISMLYPGTGFASTYGTIRGFVYFSDGITQFQGANVIAQKVDDPGTPADETRRVAVSVVSGLYFTGNPGQSITGDNTGGSSFGSRDPGVIGYYEIPVPPGDYAVLVERIRLAFTGGSGVGPLDPPVAEGFSGEYWNQSESNSDSASLRDPISVSAGHTISDVNVIINSTPPRFDQYEDGIVDLRPRSEKELFFRAVIWSDRRRV
jgi:hypothetical protein